MRCSSPVRSVLRQGGKAHTGSPRIKDRMMTPWISMLLVRLVITLPSSSLFSIFFFFVCFLIWGLVEYSDKPSVRNIFGISHVITVLQGQDTFWSLSVKNSKFEGLHFSKNDPVVSSFLHNQLNYSCSKLVWSMFLLQRAPLLAAGL